MVIVGQFGIHTRNRNKIPNLEPLRQHQTSEYVIFFIQKGDKGKEGKEEKKKQLDMILAGTKQLFVIKKQRRKTHTATQDIPDTIYEKQITKSVQISSTKSPWKHELHKMRRARINKILWGTLSHHPRLTHSNRFRSFLANIASIVARRRVFL